MIRAGARKIAEGLRIARSLTAPAPAPHRSGIKGRAIQRKPRPDQGASLVRTGRAVARIAHGRRDRPFPSIGTPLTRAAIDLGVTPTRGLQATKEWLKRIPGIIPAARRLRSLATPLGRGRLRAIRSGAQLFQPATVTRADRHPLLFGLVATHLADRAAPRILSFGCSTGEEAFTLARYLPRATIDAIDANPACIARAIDAARRLDHRRITFLCADTPDAASSAGYDVVVCLSVLRHGDLDALRLASAAALFPFARFTAAIEALDRRVRPGGLLLLWGCQFRFADTTTAARYRAVPISGMRPQNGRIYGMDDRWIPDERCTTFAFVKNA